MAGASSRPKYADAVSRNIGQRGDWVATRSQEVFNSATDPGSVDGDFGPKTEAAVKAYQQDRAVHVDGIVGDQTWWVPAGAAGATLASLSGLTTV